MANEKKLGSLSQGELEYTTMLVDKPNTRGCDANPLVAISQF
jgi:hypothetical protein